MRRCACAGRVTTLQAVGIALNLGGGTWYTVQEYREKEAKRASHRGAASEGAAARSNAGADEAAAEKTLPAVAASGGGTDIGASAAGGR